MAIDILLAIVAVSNTAQEMKSSIKDFFLSSLVTFTEEILNRKLHFLCSKNKGKYWPDILLDSSSRNIFIKWLSFSNLNLSFAGLPQFLIMYILTPFWNCGTQYELPSHSGQIIQLKYISGVAIGNSIYLHRVVFILFSLIT